MINGSPSPKKQVDSMSDGSLDNLDQTPIIADDIEVHILGNNYNKP